MGQGASGLKALKRTDPTASWQICDQLGSGSYGTVNKVIARTDGEVAAAKLINLQTKEELNTFAEELKVLTSRRHMNITNFVDGFLRSKDLWIIIELCEAGSFADVMDTMGRPLTDREIQCVAFQALEGLDFLHTNCVIHRDIKAANIMLSDHGLAKLGDFGVSAVLRSKQQRRSSFIGSPNWMAPEVAACETDRTRSYNFKADIWSLGATVIELAQNKAPFNDMHALKVLMCVTSGTVPTLDEPQAHSPDMIKFLSFALTVDASARPDAATLQRHAFCNGQTDRHLLARLASDKLEADHKARQAIQRKQSERIQKLRQSFSDLC
ncbi:STE/STE20/SLK protein kinase [Salpingoeca rosetta]|uniref:non-specific serine/threonine protein kinase n=1 Tax=Salpingoeca rosetta (strain ATCC 50818 / BSB-021) TaxID=946362 RepID=F2UJ74_SALR5|nr:STE/STE20/SLK protein kinase [Salpingoeca rosetta]EGD77022.1 STE/STE20/SLK protein kinase [Salpingoeca rosetta]|eukprot:XP_004990862.1 STE/STE20/SLK protein kinase [Salpingoeca rosetta]